MKLFKSREEREAIDTGRAEFESLAKQLVGNPTQIRALAEQVRQHPPGAELSEKERRKLVDQAFERYANSILADDILSVEEEDAFTELGAALGLEQEDLQSRHMPVLRRLVIARANDGRPQVIDSAPIMTKKGESVHYEVAAQLLKEVVMREFRAGYSGVSVRIAKGVRVNTGGARGRSVVVGTQIVTEDVGPLVITSQRAVFLGNKTTMEFPYAKLLNIDMFSDGIRFHASNRQRAPLFKVDDGELVAALLNGAVQSFNG